MRAMCSLTMASLKSWKSTAFTAAGRRSPSNSAASGLNSADHTSPPWASTAAIVSKWSSSSPLPCRRLKYRGASRFPARYSTSSIIPRRGARSASTSLPVAVSPASTKVGTSPISCPWKIRRRSARVAPSSPCTISPRRRAASTISRGSPLDFSSAIASSSAVLPELLVPTSRLMRLSPCSSKRGKHRKPTMEMDEYIVVRGAYRGDGPRGRLGSTRVTPPVASTPSRASATRRRWSTAR